MPYFSAVSAATLSNASAFEIASIGNGFDPSRYAGSDDAQVTLASASAPTPGWLTAVQNFLAKQAKQFSQVPATWGPPPKGWSAANPQAAAELGVSSKDEEAPGWFADMSMRGALIIGGLMIAGFGFYRLTHKGVAVTVSNIAKGAGETAKDIVKGGLP
jgi:hypothetical protein